MNKTAVFFCHLQERNQLRGIKWRNGEVRIDQLRQLMSDLQVPDAEEEIIQGPHKAKVTGCPQHKEKTLLLFCVLLNRLNNEAPRIKETSEQD